MLYRLSVTYVSSSAQYIALSVSAVLRSIRHVTADSDRRN